jgi:RNA-directed DNA polymerase
MVSDGRRARGRGPRDKGSPGVKAMTIDDGNDYLHERWPSIRSQLLEGSYQAAAGRAGQIPNKPPSTDRKRRQG